jgi:hypothetical protein
MLLEYELTILSFASGFFEEKPRGKLTKKQTSKKNSPKSYEYSQSTPAPRDDATPGKVHPLFQSPVDHRRASRGVWRHPDGRMQ